MESDGPRRAALPQWIVWAVLIPWLVGGCGARVPGERGTIPEKRIHGVIETLTPEIEALYLAWHRLDAAYKDIKALEKGFLFEPDDRQLGYIQKAALYVQEASLRIHHQWQRLSVIHYIRPQMFRDYLTLCVKQLTADLDGIGYDRMFLRIYSPSIADSKVADALDQALARIDDNVAVLNRIRELLKPMADPRALPL